MSAKKLLKISLIIVFVFFYSNGCEIDNSNQIISGSDVLTDTFEGDGLNADELRVMEQNFIWSPQSWIDICEYGPCEPPGFDANISDFLYEKAMMYAKSTAHLTFFDANNQPHFCSGFLVDSEWLVTANHCPHLANLPTPGHSLNARFGQYAFGSYSVGPFTGAFEGRTRFLQWMGGNPIPLTSSGNLSFANDQLLTSFNCNYESSSFQSIEGMRDINYYRCAPNIIQGMEVYPGDLYGHVNVADSGQHMGVNERIFSISTNTINGEPSTNPKHILISDGTVYDGNDEYCGVDDPNNNCFETVGDDSICGSSGGLILRASDLKAKGVIKGNLSIWDPPGYDSAPNGDPACNRYPQNTENAWKFSNLHSYLTSKVNIEYANTTPTFTSYISLQPAFPTWPWNYLDPVWVGGQGGTIKTLKCPVSSNGLIYVAAGIIGSTAYSSSGPGPVGNFGLVCVPYNVSTISREMDRAIVIVGGSVGTGFEYPDFPKNYDLNTYYNEHVAHEGAVYNVQYSQNQTVRMCKPGYALNGLGVRHTSTNISRINDISCYRLQSNYFSTGRQIYTSTLLDQSGLIGQATNGNLTNLLCEDGSIYGSSWPRFVTGFKIRSGWLTDGFQLICGEQPI